MTKCLTVAVVRFSILLVVLFSSFSGNAESNLSTKEFSRVAHNIAARQSSIYHITTDSNGLLWLATDTDGILRFDGKQFVRWTDSVLSTEQSVDFSKLRIDNDNIWAATWGHGLVAWNSATQAMTQFKAGKNSGLLKNNRVQTLYIDRQQRLWVGTLNGLQYIDIGTSNKNAGSLQFIDAEHPLNNLRIWWITESERWLWIASSQGLFRVAQDLSSWTRYYIDADNVGENRANEVRTIELIGDTLWAGTDHGLYYLSENSRAFQAVKNNDDVSSVNLRVNDLVLETGSDLEPTLWIGAGNGLYQFDLNKKEFVKQGDDWATLQNIDVRSLHLDENNTLWVGTRGQGLFKGMTLSQNFVDPLAMSSLGAAKAPVQAVHYASDDTLWLANDEGIFKRRSDLKNWDFYPFPEALGVRKVDVLYADRSGDLWIGTNQTVIKTSSDTPELIRNTAMNEHLGLDEATLTAIHEMKNGDILLGIWGRGVARYDRETATFSWQSRTFDELLGDQAYSIIDTEGSGIYIATRYSGLINLFNQERVKGEFNDHTLTCAYATDPNSIWLCSDNGIWNYHFETGAVLHYTESDGLPSNRILGMTDDGHGNLWVISLGGLARISISSGKIITLGKADGLSTANFLEHAIDSSSDGEVTLGSLEGAISFQPESLNISEIAPKVALTGIVADNKNITREFALTAREILLPDDFQALRLSFGVTDFRAPEKNAIRYRLSGVSDSWSHWMSKLSINLNSLAPGTYELLVEGRNSQGTESDKPLRLRITVDPPWWYSFWTLLFASTGFIVLIYIVIRVRVKNLERVNRKLQEQIALHTRELKVANKKLQTLSETDALTGLLNRRGFENRFNRLLEEYRSADTPISLLLIDVDHFKQFNDDFGHEIGDVALKVVGECLMTCFRDRDIIARWGGEEFTVALPELAFDEATRVAERVREKIAKQEIDNAGERLSLTVTIGVSCFAARNAELQTWLSLADEALYQGKRQGRDQVVG